MPNGGTDCCAKCLYNRAIEENVNPAPEQYELFSKLSYCALRDTDISNPFWTYCRNFGYENYSEMKNNKEIQEGSILASGLYEGYVRIPWDHKNEPRVSVPALCSICGRKTDEGIEITHENQNFGFCTNRHYVQWWKTIHHDDSLKDEDFESPEDRYKK